MTVPLYNRKQTNMSYVIVLVVTTMTPEPKSLVLQGWVRSRMMRSVRLEPEWKTSRSGLYRRCRVAASGTPWSESWNPSWRRSFPPTRWPSLLLITPSRLMADLGSPNLSLGKSSSYVNCAHVYKLRYSQGVTKRCRLPWLAFVIEPNCGGRGVSANEYSSIYTGAQINFGDITPYMTYG